MNPKLVVTHCLALMSEHAGQMTQADKDFFDGRVDEVIQDTNDLFVAVLVLLTRRLSLDLPEYEAEEVSTRLTTLQAERYGHQLYA